MSVTLANARAKRLPFSVNLAGEGEPEAVINGEFSPRCYSPNRLIELNSLDSDDPKAWAHVLASPGKGGKLLASWDLIYGEQDAADGLCSTEEIGKPVPIEVERLADLPLEILAAVSDAIAKAARPNSKPSAGTSESGSSLAEEEGPLLGNIDLSKPQDTSE